MRRLAGLVGFIAALFAVTTVGLAAEPEMALGSPSAKVTVVEYASLSCPHCAHFNNEEFPAFKARYVDTGKVRYVYREFLTDPAQVAAMGALIARCAGPKGYFAVVDTIFKGQAEMYRSGEVAPLMLAAGKAGGLDEAKVRACVADAAALDALGKRVQGYIEQQKIQGTPTFVINGKVYAGAPTAEGLSAAIEPLLGPVRRR